MTTFDVLTTPEAVALLAAIDAGEDDALLPLADLLEEAQDQRAAGLRQIAGGGVNMPRYTGMASYGWMFEDEKCEAAHLESMASAAENAGLTKLASRHPRHVSVWRDRIAGVVSAVAFEARGRHVPLLALASALVETA